MELGRVDGLLSEAGCLLLLLRTEAWGIDGGGVDTNFFTVTWGELRTFYGLVDADLLAVAWLKLGTVLTFSKVDFCVVEAATSTFNKILDFMFDTVTKLAEGVRKVWKMRKVYFDAFGCLLVWSERRRKLAGGKKIRRPKRFRVNKLE